MKFSKSQNMCCVMIRSARVLHKGEFLRFLTLSTAPNMKRSLGSAWHILIIDIKRLSIDRLLKDGYLKKDKINYFYGDKDWSSFMKCSYLVVETTEGVSGVYHILMYGDYLPHQWLKDRWLSITGSAKSLWIEFIKGSDKAVGEYVISQYVSGQSKFKKYSCSRDFTFQGFADYWRLHKRINNMVDADARKKAYLEWDVKLKRFLLYGEWGLIRNIKVSEMKSYFEEFGSKIVGVSE